MGFNVIKQNDFNRSSSSSFKSIVLNDLFWSRAPSHFLRVSNSNKSFLSLLDSHFLAILPILFWIISKSDIINSTLIISISLIGSTPPSTWIMSEFSKHLTTSTIASTSLIWDKNLLPNPSPFDAPLTSPAISVNS